jgi:ferrous iron transport protein A
LSTVLDVACPLTVSRKEINRAVIKSLNDLNPEESGIVCKIEGGHGLIDRLNSLGIRTGKKITKVSSMLLHGPVTIQVDRTKVAIGFGMAGKIFVEVDDQT